jgi:hypothetical protein
MNFMLLLHSSQTHLIHRIIEVSITLHRSDFAYTKYTQNLTVREPNISSESYGLCICSVKQGLEPVAEGVPVKCQIIYCSLMCKFRV